MTTNFAIFESFTFCEMPVQLITSLKQNTLINHIQTLTILAGTQSCTRSALGW